MNKLTSQGAQDKKKHPIWSGRFAKLVFEFIVIFLGVYLAFLFTDYQEGIKEREIRIKYYNSLIFEFQIFATHLEQEEKKLIKYSNLIEKIQQGEQPALLLTDLYYLYDGTVVRAAFNSTNFESLDEDLLQSIIRGTLLLKQLEQKISRFNQKIQTALLPIHLSANPQYYDSQGKLLPHLQWYPQLLGEIEQNNRRLHSIVMTRAIPDMERQKAKLLERLYNL